MNRLRLVAFALLALAALLLGTAAAQGNVRVGFFLIIPFVSGQGFLPFLGMMSLMAGVFLLFVSAIPRAPDGWTYEAPQGGAGAAGAPAPERRVRSGGVVLLGPIPIVWGSDRRILPWMVGLGALLLVLALAFTLLAR